MANPKSPGWYDDPENPQQLRYFDGVVWTRHTTPRSTRPAPGASAAQPGSQGSPTAQQGQGQQGYGQQQWPGQQLPPSPQQQWPPQSPQQPYGPPGGGRSRPPA